MTVAAGTRCLQVCQRLIAQRLHWEVWTKRRYGVFTAAIISDLLLAQQASRQEALMWTSGDSFSAYLEGNLAAGEQLFALSVFISSTDSNVLLRRMTFWITVTCQGSTPSQPRQLAQSSCCCLGLGNTAAQQEAAFSSRSGLHVELAVGMASSRRRRLHRQNLTYSPKLAS